MTFFGDVISWFAMWIDRTLHILVGWLVDLTWWIFQHVYAFAVDLLGWFFSAVLPKTCGAVEVSACFDMADSLGIITTVGGGLFYFFTLAQFKFGLSVCFWAILARFVIRRIPVFG